LKPIVAVSRCLLGELVRYDGLTKSNKWIIEELSKIVKIYPVCPEVEAGLSIPRPAVQLVQKNNKIKVLGVNDNGLDVTHLLTQFSQSQKQQMQNISGYIFKSRSPSCGIEDVPILDLETKEKELGSGIHASWIINTFPKMPIITDENLAIKAKRDLFLAEILEYQ